TAFSRSRSSPRRQPLGDTAVPFSCYHCLHHGYCCKAHGGGGSACRGRAFAALALPNKKIPATNHLHLRARLRRETWRGASWHPVGVRYDVDEHPSPAMYVRQTDRPRRAT
ncbi:unnamed protein product, partial [Ectocarpus sp. 12 AP-2014]